MVFSSKIFLFFFLPAVLTGYFMLRKHRRASNLFLTLASLVFYAWGEPQFVFVMHGRPSSSTGCSASGWIAVREDRRAGEGRTSR